MSISSTETVHLTKGHVPKPHHKHKRSKTDPSCKVVVIEHDAMTLRFLWNQLGKAGFETQTATTLAAGLELIDESVAVVLIDQAIPDSGNFSGLRDLQKNLPSVQVIVLTDTDNNNDAANAINIGAIQFVAKPRDPGDLIELVANAIISERSAPRKNHLNQYPTRFSQPQNFEPTDELHGGLLKQIEQIAALESTVFIGGETGTGKSTVARLIHNKSKRAEGPFVSVNCASLPKELIQSELFGHVKGSFTGATNDRQGHAEVANGGTLFLDEIGDLPMELQPKLLTFLQDRTVQRLGETKTKRVDVRLIAASHCDLAAMCREGKFRQDLYFRLLVLSLEMPALRRRQSEFNNIAEQILKAICQRQSLPLKSFSNGAMEMLKSHTWPGNIRELENVLERAVAFAADSTIEPRDLLFSNVNLDRRNESQAEPASKSELPTTQPETESNSEFIPGYRLAGRTLEEIEREAIIQTLAAMDGNKAKTARTLGISEKSIYNKMRRLKIS